MKKTVKVYANVDEGYVSFSNLTKRQEDWVKVAEEQLAEYSTFITAIAILWRQFPNDAELGKKVRELFNSISKV